MNKVCKTTREKWFETALTVVVGCAMYATALSIERWF